MARAKTAYTATFADGEVMSLKGSGREYSHAWRVVLDDRDGTRQTYHGWAGTTELAHKAMRTETRWHRSEPRDYRRWAKRPWAAGTIISEELAPAVKG